MQSSPLISAPLLSQRQAFAAFLQGYVLSMFSFDSDQWSTSRDDPLNRLTAIAVACLGMIATSLTSPRPGFHFVRARDRSTKDGPAAGKAISTCNLPNRASRRILPGRPVYGGNSRGRAPCGLPTNLLRALIWAESRNPMAVSPAGAAGLAQLMPPRRENWASGTVMTLLHRSTVAPGTFATCWTGSTRSTWPWLLTMRAQVPSPDHAAFPTMVKRRNMSGLCWDVGKQLVRTIDETT